MEGWIKLSRNIKNNFLWEDKPFSRGQAWIDLLMTVNHKENKIMFNGSLVDVERGEKITSIRNLCDSWGWSNTKVKKFLELLQEEKMITYKSDSKKTTINIVNYRFYQDSEVAEKDVETSPKHHQNVADVEGVEEVPAKSITKKVKKYFKLDYSETVNLTEEEYQKLFGEYDSNYIKAKILSLDSYLIQNPKKYKNHYRTILNWINRDGDKVVKKKSIVTPHKEIEVPNVVRDWA